MGIDSSLLDKELKAPNVKPVIPKLENLEELPISGDIVSHRKLTPYQKKMEDI